MKEITINSVKRLVAAAEVLLENLADADQTMPDDGDDVYPDIKELQEAIAEVKAGELGERSG